jgi:hypothetical protein
MYCPRRSYLPQLSIVLPVLGRPGQMEDSLVSVLENRPEGCEVLVVLNQPYDDPYELAGEVQFLEVPRGAGLSEAINRGVEASRAPIVHVVPCGVLAREGWCEAALERFGDPQIAAVNPLLLDAANRRRLVSAGAAYQRWGRVRRFRKTGPAKPRRDVVADPDFAAAFYRKSALEQVGLFSRRFGPRMSTVAVQLALQDAGFHCALETSCRMLAKGKGTESALARGWSSERLFWRRLPAQRRKRWLAMHGLLVAAETATGLVRPSRFLELAGRLAAAAVEQLRPGGEPKVERREPLEGPHFPTAGANSRTSTRQTESV